MTFDPNEFLNTTVTDANDTKVIPPPENMAGDGYQILVDKLSFRTWQKKDDPSVSGLSLDVFWSIEDESVKQFCNREKILCKQSLRIDLNESGTGYDMARGKNIDLGKLRDVFDLNEPGKPFNVNMFLGRMAKGFVQHRVDGENVYAEIKRVAKL